MERRDFIRICAATAAAATGPAELAAIRAPVADTCVVQPIENYCRQQVKC